MKQDNSGYFKIGGSVLNCYCIKCGENFFRRQGEAASSKNENAFLNADKIIDQINKFPKRKFKINNATDLIVLKIYLCDNCLNEIGVG
jgi:hypothetical protein